MRRVIDLYEAFPPPPPRDWFDVVLPAPGDWKAYAAMRDWAGTRTAGRWGTRSVIAIGDGFGSHICFTFEREEDAVAFAVVFGGAP
jgi:hypothetical protein